MPLGPFIEQRVIFVGPGTSLVEIELRPVLPRSDILEQISVTDQTGVTIASSPLVEAGSPIKLRLRPDLDFARSPLPVPLVLKVALHQVSPATLPTSTPEAEVKAPGQNPGRFTIVVRQQTSANTPEPPGRPASEPSDAPPPAGSPIGPVTSVTNGSHGTSAHSEASSPNPSRSVLGPLVPTGPLPSQSAAAVGGVFSVGVQSPIADPHDPTMVDLSLLELAPADARDPARRENAPEEVGGARAGLDPEPMFDPSSTAVVAVRGPGGFPLFGSSLRTEPRSRASEPLPALPTLIAEAPPSVEAAEGDLGAVAERSNDTSRRPAGPRLASRTVALVAMFTAGAVLTSVPILPDVLATLRERRGKARPRQGHLPFWQGVRPA
ncbi:MAG: hypothetical protein U0835_15610 [Isosphaeraceae bacterium]